MAKQINNIPEDWTRRIEAYIEELKKANPGSGFEASHGLKYTKIIEHKGGTFVLCFIERSNGDVHKAADWDRVQKGGVRGNLYKPERPVQIWDFYLGRRPG